MKYIVDNKRYEGTPGEIAEFIALSESAQPQNALIGMSNPQFDDMSPLENIVNESERLRAELANNPDYNPYTTVSPSPENEDKPIIVGNKSELDTGVEYI